MENKKPEYKYFQTMYEKKNENPEIPPFCDTLTVLYKGISLIEFYMNDMQEEGEALKGMNPNKRKKYIFDNYSDFIFDDDYANDVLTDNDYFPPKTLSYKEKIEEIYWD